MSDIQNIGTILSDSLLLSSSINDIKNSKLQKVQEQMKSLPAVADKSTLSKLVKGEYEISLKEYTNMSTYNTMMNALYGESSADPFQNILKINSGVSEKNSAQNSLVNAKTFVDKMKENGMSNKDALKMYSALQKYSLMTSFRNYNFVSARA